MSAVVLLALSATFAVELSHTQSRNRADIRHRVHERGVLAASLIDGLFQTVTHETTTYTRRYGATVVRQSTVDQQNRSQRNAFIAVLDAGGHLLARSTGFSAAALAGLRGDPSFGYVAKAGYGLGDLHIYQGRQVLLFAVRFPSMTGTPRILLSGFPVSSLGQLLLGDLSKIPGVTGERNYVIDGNGAVLAAVGRGLRAGQGFPGPVPPASRANFSADRRGYFYDEVQIAGSSWRIVLDSPDGPLYASVSGLNKWLPWLIFAAFAFVGLIAFGLVARVLKAVGEASDANARLATLNGELEQTNVMLEQRATELARSNEELDQFASIASHDLQEPLRKVRTFAAEVTRMDAENLSDKGREYLGRASAAAERMQTLIEDLLKFSRVSTHTTALAVVDLSEVVAEALDDLSEVIERTGARVHVSELPTIAAEPLQIRQLVQNLLSNALKFQAPDAIPEVWIDAVTVDGEVSISFRDNGIGFDPRYAARIFRVFERLHGRNEFSGTGIGLALCRKIAERHGGTVTAASEPGVGSTFTVLLPQVPPPGAGRPAEAAWRVKRGERTAAHA
jgi:signal transduction histidine kinase